MPIEPLADSSHDILCKAMRGLKISPAEVANKAQLPLEHVNALLEGRGNELSLQLAATALHLHPKRLLSIHRNEYHPRISHPPEEWRRFQTDFMGMLVNSYLIWDTAARSAAAFDTGSDASGLLDCLARYRLQLKFLFLTHSHGDHIFDLDRVLEKTGATAWIAEELLGAQPLQPGQTFLMDDFVIEARKTCGHSPLGITYVVHNRKYSAAFVGDAVFAGSIGMPNCSYQEALQSCVSNIFSLPEDMLLCPGHGPLTSVGEEKASNPFFPKTLLSNFIKQPVIVKS
ncbi:MAG: MBL fold metallo-hydrolase [Candidatus Xiphinematobacter sp.]|nr:MAG: MBL fold metallo-hydrolase [Candidatus Xiphinematobacter sp.]